MIKAWSNMLSTTRNQYNADLREPVPRKILDEENM